MELGVDASLAQYGVGRGPVMAQLGVGRGENITPFWIMTFV